MKVFLLLSALCLWACTKVAPKPTPPKADLAAPLLDGMGRAMLDPTRVDIMQPAALVARMHLQPAAIVADIGAGPGAFTHALSNAVPRGKVIATDLKNDYLERIEKDARANGETNVEVRVVGKDTPGLAAREVDVVFMCQVDHYLGDRTPYFLQLAAALKPGGRIVIVNYLKFRDTIDQLAPTLGWREVDRWEPVQGFFARVYEVGGP